MSDVRARIADALHDNGCHPDDAAELADALLSLRGIAIVELPEPSYIDEPELDVKGYGFNGGPSDTHVARVRGVYAHDGLVYDQWDGVTPAEARMVASWWLAAAEAAERNSRNCPDCGSTNPERIHYGHCPTIGSRD